MSVVDAAERFLANPRAETLAIEDGTRVAPTCKTRPDAATTEAFEAAPLRAIRHESTPSSRS